MPLDSKRFHNMPACKLFLLKRNYHAQTLNLITIKVNRIRPSEVKRTFCSHFFTYLMNFFVKKNLKT